MKAAPAEIASVEPGQSGSTGDVRWALDWPRRGETVESRDVELRGWVLATAENPPVAVEVLIEGRVIARAPLDRARPDLEQAFPDKSPWEKAGFQAAVDLIAVHTPMELRLRVVLADQARQDLVAVEAKPSWRVGVDPDREVSVVIPCFNQAHFLAPAIESVLDQSEPVSDVIVVDDGSRDNTVEVVGRYPGVRYLHQLNSGLAAARNAGLDQVETAVVAFLDSDDRLLPNAVETGLRELEADPDAVMAAGAWRLIGEDGQVLPSSPPELPDDVLPALLESCFISTPAAVMYRRRLFSEIGGFDPEVSASADYDLYLRVAARYPVRIHRGVVAEYRRHGANMTRDAELIMRSELAVLKRQAHVVKQRPGLRDARERGLRRSRAYHGERMVDEVRRQVDEGRREEALRTTASLARLYPRGVPRAVRALARQGLR